MKIEERKSVQTKQVFVNLQMQNGVLVARLFYYIHSIRLIPISLNIGISADLLVMKCMLIDIFIQIRANKM